MPKRDISNLEQVVWFAAALALFNIGATVVAWNVLSAKESQVLGADGVVDKKYAALKADMKKHIQSEVRHGVVSVAKESFASLLSSPQGAWGVKDDRKVEGAKDRSAISSPPPSPRSPLAAGPLYSEIRPGVYRVRGWTSELGPNHSAVIAAKQAKSEEEMDRIQLGIAAHSMSGEHIEQLEFEKFRAYHAARLGHTGGQAVGNDAETGRPVWLERGHATSEAVLKGGNR